MTILEQLVKLNNKFNQLHQDFSAVEMQRVSQYYVDVPKMLSGILKSSLGHHFDEATKMVNCPCGFTADSHEEIFVYAYKR